MTVLPPRGLGVLTRPLSNSSRANSSSFGQRVSTRVAGPLAHLMLIFDPRPVGDNVGSVTRPIGGRIALRALGRLMFVLYPAVGTNIVP